MITLWFGAGTSFAQTCNCCTASPQLSFTTSPPRVGAGVGAPLPSVVTRRRPVHPQHHHDMQHHWCDDARGPPHPWTAAATATAPQAASSASHRAQRDRRRSGRPGRAGAVALPGQTQLLLWTRSRAPRTYRDASLRPALGACERQRRYPEDPSRDRAESTSTAAASVEEPTIATAPPLGGPGAARGRTGVGPGVAVSTQRDLYFVARGADVSLRVEAIDHEKWW